MKFAITIIALAIFSLILLPTTSHIYANMNQPSEQTQIDLKNNMDASKMNLRTQHMIEQKQLKTREFMQANRIVLNLENHMKFKASYGEQAWQIKLKEIKRMEAISQKIKQDTNELIKLVNTPQKWRGTV